MVDIVSLILAERFDDAKTLIEQKLYELSGAALINEALPNVRKVGRIKIVRIRIRKGKVQRRKKMSAVKGFVLRGGRVQRMKPAERLHRKRGARKAKIKRRGKLARILRKRKISLRKRHNLGL